MCGIVLAGGNLGSSDLEIFNQLLYCDVFRGQHSTGVMCKRLNETEVLIDKAALPSYAFLLREEYKKMSTGPTNYVVAPAWMVGHNRHATRGAVNDSNAHPFKHGAITLVHNGTLTNQSLLPDSSKFIVDSENICYSIDKIGAEETIQKLDGAFTLIWHDANDDTLHIIRNDERPFHLARVGTEWFGASEEDMLMWILKRARLTKSRIAEHFECEVGTEYIFDVKGGRKMVLTEKKEHKLPVFTIASRWDGYYSRSWQDYQGENYGSNSRGSAASKKESRYVDTPADQARRNKAIRDQNQIAIDKGLDIRRDQTLEFTPHTFEKYPSTTMANGKMTGYVFDDKSSEYFEVDVHNIKEADYIEAMKYPKSTYVGTIYGINIVKDMVRCVVGAGKWKNVPGLEGSSEPNVVMHEFNDDLPPFDDLPDTCITGAGVSVTRKFWEAHSHGECGGCGNHIDWKDAPKALFAYQSYWHPDCLKKSQLTDDEKDLEGEIELAVCSICSHVVKPSELDTAMSSFRQDDICKVCADEVRKKANAIKVGDAGGVWVKVIDKTSVRTPEISIRVTAQTLSRMIIMAESTKKELTMEDVSKCYFEKRPGGNFAVALLPEGVKTPAELGGVSAEPVDTFPKRKVLSLNKIVRSLDGKRELSTTKAIWSSIGWCEFCYSQIAWKDVEACTLGSYNRIVCPKETCRGKLNGSQKNPVR